MLLSLFGDGFQTSDLIKLLLFIPIILISLTVHEYCHGYAAYMCGDDTAKWNGRLTLNPIKHLDPIGTIMMLIFGFGYAKPVPVNPRNFKHYRLGLCFVSIAGPLSNVLLALIGMTALFVTIQINPMLALGEASSIGTMWLIFIINFIFANAALAVFNLLPIPPLDGSRIISAVLPAKIAYYYNKYENYIMLVVLLLLYFNILDGAIFFLRDGLMAALEGFFGLFPFSDKTKFITNILLHY